MICTMNEKEKDGLYQARRHIAAFMARTFLDVATVEDMPQELVHSFDVITDMLRTAEEAEKTYRPHHYTFAGWWSISRGIPKPESMLR